MLQFLRRGISSKGTKSLGAEQGSEVGHWTLESGVHPEPKTLNPKPSKLQLVALAIIRRRIQSFRKV